ncbi:co-chaperone HscB [Rheinheimera sp. WS51]|uniref:co-chaperone HscB n=1 Tax=Rheinheimera sp. WS51 TaxID=3425886 RepID=UPI003D922D5A
MNYFQLFNLPTQFDIDLAELSSRYLKLQRQFHPDKHSAGSERDRLMSVQQTANINDAYHSLKHPLLRAEHILALRGLMLDDEQRSFNDPMFLMQQMTLREQLAEIKTATDPDDVIDHVEAELLQAKKHLLAQLAQALEQDKPEQDQQAADLIRKLKFFYKLQHELELIEQQLKD